MTPTHGCPAPRCRTAHARSLRPCTNVSFPRQGMRVQGTYALLAHTIVIPAPTVPAGARTTQAPGRLSTSGRLQLTTTDVKTDTRHQDPRLVHFGVPLRCTIRARANAHPTLMPQPPPSSIAAASHKSVEFTPLLPLRSRVRSTLLRLQRHSLRKQLTLPPSLPPIRMPHTPAGHTSQLTCP